MRKRLMSCLSLIIILLLLAGCQSVENPTDAKGIQRLVNRTYGKYFGIHKLYCCDDGFGDDGTYYATVYGNNDRISFSVDYDMNNNILLTTASEAYHEKDIRDAVSKLIEETTGLENRDDYPETEDYDISIESEPSTEFIEDYDAFISAEGTEISIVLVFDKKISDEEEKQVQTLIEKLQEQHFKGELTYFGHENFMEDVDF